MLWPLLLIGCGAEVSVPGDEPPPEVLAACSAPAGSWVDYSTEDELLALIVGTWTRCDQAIPGFEGEVTGVEITAEHEWWAVARDAGGELVRTGGGGWAFHAPGSEGLAPDGGIEIIEQNGGSLLTDLPFFDSTSEQMHIGVNPYYPVYVPLPY